MVEALRARIPDKRNVTTIYAVAVFLVYTWTLFVSFWKLPSWLFFLKIGEVASIYSYAFLVNFAESILLLLVVFLLSIMLPQRWWRDAFISKGFILILIILGSAMLHLALFRTPDTREAFVTGQFNWWLVTLMIAVSLTWTVGKVKWIRQGLENLADRFVVFLYVYLPLTGIALLVVLLRIYF